MVSSSSGLPFLDKVNVIEVSSTGQTHVYSDYGVTIVIPDNAVPQNMTVHLEISVKLYGPFVYLKNKVPISPVLWICFQEAVELQRPLTIYLSHFLNLNSASELSGNIIIGKATHKLDERSQFVFEQLNVPVELSSSLSCGVFQTNHCCFLCLQAGKKIVESPLSIAYCMSIIEEVVKDRHVYNFCLTFEHQACLKVCIDTLYSNHATV